MTIIRVAHNKENPFVMISKASLWDKNLSLEAVGLWSRLLSKPNNWEVRANQLATSCGCSIKKIYRLLAELIANRYCGRSQEKGKNKKFENVTYTVFESPMEIEDFQKMFPHTQKRLSGKPLSGKRHTTNTEKTETEVKDIPPPQVPKSEPPVIPDPPPPTKEEDEEIDKRLKERSSKATRIASMKKWRSEVLRGLRMDCKAREGDSERFQRHKAEAESKENQKWDYAKNFTVTACKECVEFTSGSQYVMVRYDVSDEEWRRKTKWS